MNDPQGVLFSHLRAQTPLLQSTFERVFVSVRDKVRMRPVDWLAWEDPFIFDRPAAELRTEREQSEAENRKRLGYVIPMLQLLYERAFAD